MLAVGTLESGSVRRWVGVEGDVVGGDGVGLLARVGWGPITKTLKYKPNGCVLDPTWRSRLMWHIPKRCV